MTAYSKAAKRAGRKDYASGNKAKFVVSASRDEDYSLNSPSVRYLLFKQDCSPPNDIRRDLREEAIEAGPICCVYFIRMGTTDAVKVGKASDGLSRLDELQVGSPVRLNFAGFLNYRNPQEMNTAETIAHEIAANATKQKLLGEWFTLNQVETKSTIMELFQRTHTQVMGMACSEKPMTDEELRDAVEEAEKED